jgi:hypothetical protein
MTRTRKKPASTFKGILAEPFPGSGPFPSERNLFATPVGEIEGREKRFAEVLRRMVALLDHYRIPRANLDAAETWYWLAVKLACEHLDAFKPTRPRRGPGILWSDIELGCLVAALRRLDNGKARTTWKARCAKLESQEPWRSFIKRKDMTGRQSYDKGETLYRQLKKAQKSEAALVWAVIAWESHLYDPNKGPETLRQVLEWAQEHQHERK